MLPMQQQRNLTSNLMQGVIPALCLLCSAFCVAQNPIDVAESTLKIGGLSEEVFYYGFAEGDKLIFSFEELKGKELKEVEIIELPSSSKFMDYKTKRISEKTLEIGRTGIYKFRFVNTAIGGRVCKFNIKRIPASSDTQSFNTSVHWRTAYDSTYTQVQETYLESVDTLVDNVIDQITKVSSGNALNGNPNHTIVDFELPVNTVAWSYYIGVGNEGHKAFDSAKDDFVNAAVANVSEIPGYGVMAALAIYGINTFSKVQGSDNVKYWFIPNWENVQQFQLGNSFLHYKQGDVVSDAGQMKSPLEGKTYLALYNDNVIEPIDVVVKIVAIQVKEKYSTRVVDKLSINSYQIPYLIK